LTDVPAGHIAPDAVPPEDRGLAHDAHGPSTTAHDEHGLVAHHFDDAQQQHDAVELGMWSFLAQEVLFFGGLFLAYLLYRFQYPEEFAEGSTHLNKWLGCANTMVLLGSSFTMALAVHAAKHDDKKGLFRYLTLTLVLGTIFLVVKYFEWSHDYHLHLIPGSFFGWDYSHYLHGRDPSIGQHVQMYFYLYFCMTGLHALHMVVGMAILGWLAYKAFKLRTSLRDANFTEMMGLYWHFVDIVWIFLYPFLYLIKP
jgi:cytochrome c oxidase subunit III